MSDLSDLFGNIFQTGTAIPVEAENIHSFAFVERFMSVVCQFLNCVRVSIYMTE